MKHQFLALLLFSKLAPLHASIEHNAHKNRFASLADIDSDHENESEIKKPLSTNSKVQTLANNNDDSDSDNSGIELNFRTEPVHIPTDGSPIFVIVDKKSGLISEQSNFMLRFFNPDYIYLKIEKPNKKALEEQNYTCTPEQLKELLKLESSHLIQSQNKNK